MADPILSLTTKKVRRSIQIDETAYTLLDLEDLSLADQYACIAKMKSIQEIRKAGSEMTAENVQELSTTTNVLLKVIVPEIGAVIDQLNVWQKTSIINAFLAEPAPKPKTNADAGTSSIEPPDSAVSSAEPSKAGSEVVAVS